MTLFPLNDNERGRLQRLGKQKDILFALKKLAFNTATKGTLPADVQTLAAERIAIDIIQDIFHQLEIIQPDNKAGEPIRNLV